MNSNNNEHDIQAQIKSILPIEDIIGERVRLRRTSRGYMGLCPFHQEDTPSFHVYTDTQSYYCFGCHEAGDIFGYVMKTENLTFPEALKLLADRAGIRLLTLHSQHSRSLYDVMSTAAKFFRTNLLNTHGTAARAYMKRRQLGESDVDRFTFGYSLNSWDSLTRHFREQGITDRELLASGLVVRGNKGLYDRFRGRLMFGIRDIAGKVIGFGGRLIDGEGAKYINSPEGDLYRKRSNLYLLDSARKFMREKGRSILVEGYMDALRLHKSGFGETVASLGTSLTEQQAELLYRFADKCYICYDSDSAGQSAVMKGMYLLAEHGIDVRVVMLPDTKDPDDYLCSHNPDDFEELLRNAESLITHHLKHILPKMKESAGRRRVLREFLEQLSRLDRFDVLDHKAEICDTLNLRPSDIDEYLYGSARSRYMPPSEANVGKGILSLSQASGVAPDPNAYDDSLEGALCAMMLHSQEFRLKIAPDEVMSLLNTQLARDTALSVMTEDISGLSARWTSSGHSDRVGLIVRGEELCAQMLGKTDAEKWESICSGLKWRQLDRRIREIDALPVSERDMHRRFELVLEREKYSR